MKLLSLMQGQGPVPNGAKLRRFFVAVLWGDPSFAALRVLLVIWAHRIRLTSEQVRLANGVAAIFRQ
jgi:hypothetical protein